VIDFSISIRSICWKLSYHPFNKLIGQFVTGIA